MTTYDEALTRLLSIPTSPKFGLQRMRDLLHALGDPHEGLVVLHVAGTKGKGSTCAFVDAIAAAAGLRRGLTTSPHLRCARERICIDGAPIDEPTFVSLALDVERAAASLSPEVPTFFERMIAMALLGFARARVDVAIVEVGLGGRLDATNVVAPRACAISRIGLDHLEWLGTTLDAIAREKAGILKPGIPAVTVAQAPEARTAILEVAANVGAPVSVIDADMGLAPSLFGAHQRENASLAAALVRAAGLAIDEDTIARGVASASWPGRWEHVASDPVVVLDGAHNIDSADVVARALDDDPRTRDRCVHLVIGMTRGHEPGPFVARVAARATTVVIAEANQPRALPASVLASAAAREGHDVDVVPAVVDALSLAQHRARADGGVVLVTGSLYVVGEARAQFFAMPADPALPSF